MRLTLVGETAADVLAGRHTGRVLAVFRRAVYLAFPRGVVALVDVNAEPGPLHAHVHLDLLPHVGIGDPVRAEGGGGLWIAGASIAGDADVWRAPPPPVPTDLPAVATTLRGVLDHSPDLDLAGGAGPATEERLSATLERRGLDAAATELAGRGAGLTPAGDDVLAGLLLVGRAAAGPASEARLVALARTAATHQISRSHLESAARGRSVAAVHDLIGACAAGEAGGARAARARLARIGHSSGLDMAYGVLVGSANRATSPWLGTPPVGGRSVRHGKGSLPTVPDGRVRAHSTMQPTEARMSTRTVSAQWLGGYKVQVDAGGFQVRVDEPLSVGGTDTGPQPTDYLLASIASCFVLALVYSARKYEVELPGSVEVTVTGTYDGPRFSRIAINVAATLPDGAAERLLTSAERVCYVTNTLRRPPEITVELRQVQG